VPGMLYLMPKTIDGEIITAVCLSPNDLERLRADETFTSYAREL